MRALQTVPPAHESPAGDGPDAQEGHVLYFLLHLVLKPLTRLIYRPVIEGTEHVPREGALILASNHLSFVDSIVIPLVAPRKIRYMAKSQYFDGTGIVGRFNAAVFRALGAIPVDRVEARSAQLSLDTALSVLNDGDAFGIYPEGTRSRDGRLYRGRTGVAWLAMKAHAPVIPVGVVGTAEIMPVGSRFPRVRRVSVRFGAPLDFGDLAASQPPGVARRLATDRIMDAIAELSGQERADGYNELPPGD